MYGGDGNDTLRGGGSDNVLIGGTGCDQLLAGGGRDLLIGGMNSENLRGGQGEDILVGGHCTYEANETALMALMREWTRNLDYATRVAHITGTLLTGGLNGTYYLNASTVQDDGAADRDQGGAGLDLFFRSLGDQTIDLQPKKETVVTI